MERFKSNAIGDNNFVGFFLEAVVESFLKRGTEENSMRLIKEMQEKGYIEVELKINGMEVAIKGFFNEFESVINEYVKRKARDLVLDKFDILNSKIREIRSRLDTVFDIE